MGTSATAALATMRAAATEWHAAGGGTDRAPTTASASSERFSNGNDDPKPQATCSPASPARPADVTHPGHRVTRSSYRPLIRGISVRAIDVHPARTRSGDVDGRRT